MLSVGTWSVKFWLILQKKRFVNITTKHPRLVSLAGTNVLYFFYILYVPTVGLSDGPVSIPSEQHASYVHLYRVRSSEEGFGRTRLTLFIHLLCSTISYFLRRRNYLVYTYTVWAQAWLRVISQNANGSLVGAFDYSVSNLKIKPETASCLWLEHPQMFLFKLHISVN